MATKPTKTVLLAGLGRYGPPADASANLEKGQAELKRAHEAGYETSLLELNPDDVTGSLAALQEALRSKEYDAFLIGFGVRGKKEYTPLFEGVVNASREISPRMKLLFSTSPDAVFETILRGFGEGGR